MWFRPPVDNSCFRIVVEGVVDMYDVTTHEVNGSELTPHRCGAE